VSDTPRETRNEVFTAAEAKAQGMPTRNVMQDDFGFEVPVESVPLPSRGACYPSDSPLFGKDTIDIRSMTAREEDILTSRALIKKGTVITHLIKSCLIDKSIDVNAMISGDRNAIMTALRITGYGAEYNVEVDCPSCSERSKQEFSLAELPIKRLEIDPVSEGANLFEYTLPVTKKQVRVKFLTGQDEADITVQTERAKKQGGGQAENLITTRLKYSIVSVAGVSDKTKIGMFIRNMPARDSLMLRRFMDDNEPGIDMKAWMTCPHCLEHAEVRLPLGASFFWPDANR
jgi:hypothetical protein